MARLPLRPSLLAFLFVLPLLAVPGPAASQAACEVREGWDLFATVGAGTTLGVQPAVDVFHYVGVPVGVYDFGGDIGPRSVGNTDTIVVRRATATPLSPLVPVELVLLQLSPVEQPGHYVTLQSQRRASVGTLQILFDTGCQGGTLDSQFTVHFDVRVGSIHGPIVLSASETITGNGIPWQHIVPDARELVEQGRIAAHMVRDELTTRVAGVNDHLNGVDQSADFHPGVSA